MPDRKSLADLRGEMEHNLKATEDIAAKAEAENRDLSAEEMVEVKRRLDDVKLLKQRWDDVKSGQDLMSELGMFDLPDAPDRTVGADRVPAGKGSTLGEQFVGSAEFKAMMDQFPGGHIPDRARVGTAPVGVKSLFTGTSDTSAGAFVNNDFTGIYEQLGRRTLTIRDLVSTRQTTSDTVEFVRQTARVNAAAPVAEATTSAPGAITGASPGPYTVAAGSGTKPEGGFTFEKVTAVVKTIAEWVPATRRALADAAQLRGLIDQELRDDLLEVEENQILNGTGAGENLTGITNTVGTLNQAFSTDIFESVRKARTLLRVAGRSTPTAIVMHPADWETVDLAKDLNGAYRAGGPFMMGQPRLWGVPVVESEAQVQGFALLGDFRKAIVWDREQTTISVSDSHADFFVRNLVAILAEERLAFGVIRPTAFVEVDIAA